MRRAVRLALLVAGTAARDLLLQATSGQTFVRCCHRGTQGMSETLLGYSKKRRQFIGADPGSVCAYRSLEVLAARHPPRYAAFNRLSSPRFRLSSDYLFDGINPMLKYIKTGGFLFGLGAYLLWIDFLSPNRDKA